MFTIWAPAINGASRTDITITPEHRSPVIRAGSKLGCLGRTNREIPELASLHCLVFRCFSAVKFQRQITDSVCSRTDTYRVRFDKDVGGARAHHDGSRRLSHGPHQAPRRQAHYRLARCNRPANARIGALTRHDLDPIMVCSSTSNT